MVSIRMAVTMGITCVSYLFPLMVWDRAVATFSYIDEHSIHEMLEQAQKESQDSENFMARQNLKTKEDLSSTIWQGHVFMPRSCICYFSHLMSKKCDLSIASDKPYTY